MKRLLIAAVIASFLLASPRQADAGVKAGFKKVGHAVQAIGKATGYVAVGVAAIYVCAAACR